MRAAPSIEELVGVVAAFLRNEVVPAVPGPVGFHARVAATALDIVLRELALGAASAQQEQARLARLTRSEGDVETLNQALCLAIRDRRIGLDDPDLIDHLWRSTLERIAIDQPKYAAYRHELDRISAKTEEE